MGKKGAGAAYLVLQKSVEVVEMRMRIHTDNDRISELFSTLRVRNTP